MITENFHVFLFGLLVAIFTLWLGFLMHESGSSFALLTSSYINDLAPEVGGLGLAICVGGVAGFVAANSKDRLKRQAVQTYVDSKRANERSIKLAWIFSQYNRNLNIVGFQIENENISDVSVRGIKFAHEASSSGFSGVHFNNCQLEHVHFSRDKRARGKIEKCSFSSCVLSHCNFRFSQIFDEGATEDFLGSDFYRCDFSFSEFHSVSLNGATFFRCKFWGASLHNDCDMDRNHLKEFTELGVFEPKSAKFCTRGQYLKTLFRSQNRWARLYYLLRHF